MTTLLDDVASKSGQALPPTPSAAGLSNQTPRSSCCYAPPIPAPPKSPPVAGGCPPSQPGGRVNEIKHSNRSIRYRSMAHLQEISSYVLRYHGGQPTPRPSYENLLSPGLPNGPNTFLRGLNVGRVFVLNDLPASASARHCAEVAASCSRELTTAKASI